MSDQATGQQKEYIERDQGGTLDQASGRRHRRRSRDRSHPQSPESSLNLDEVREVIALMMENGLTEFEIEREGFHVRLSRNSNSAGMAPAAGMSVAAPAANEEAAPATLIPAAGAPAQTAAARAHPGAQAETAASEDYDLHLITAPIVGTFYRAPSPTAESFVRIGSHVEPEKVVCIIEAMKLMNEIQAETRGEVAKIYVENGQAVEYGQPLFGIKQ